MKPRGPAFLLAYLFLAIAFSGCNPSPPSLVTASGSVAVEETSAHYFASDDGVFLVIWHDGPEKLEGRDAHGYMGYSSSGNRTRIHGDFQIADTKVLEYSCLTGNGKSGKVLINDEEFSLEDGGLFLVSFVEGHTPVIQLELPTSDLAQLQTKLSAMNRTELRTENFLEAR
jgi:hypothetical protein